MKNLNKVFIAILFVAIFSYSADAKPRRSVKKPPAQITKVVDYKGGTDLISMASRFIGQTARQIGLPPTLWCADFIGLLTKGGTHSRAALSYKNYGKPAQTGCVNCIAVLTRKGGGHRGPRIQPDQRPDAQPQPFPRSSPLAPGGHVPAARRIECHLAADRRSAWRA